MARPIILLAAGGTGGHLFPAEALAHALQAEGYSVHLVTDSRAERFAGEFPADEIHVVPSATIGSKNPLAMAKAFWKLWSGYRAARALVRRLKPRAVVGFGGYPTVPPLMAASGLKVPCMIHEQNAVMGRANKLLAQRVTAIAGGFLPEGVGEFAAKTVSTGNPVRPAVLAAADVPYQPSSGDMPFNLVVFGGSQGAQFFSSAIPDAVALLDEAQRLRLRIVQQARPEDVDEVVRRYRQMDIPAKVSPFFGDMAERIGKAHFLICRSGASTVSEISVVGRPALLVPYPYALDHDQAANAATLSAKGGAKVIPQAQLTAENLAALLHNAMNDPERMAKMAAAAKASGKPDATTLLARLTGFIAAGKSVADFKRN
jgi:UDP-N-acetylglucosamine--N-acetylmuramyl-(pentapeptide) pyrophosphoryl-undecaprenol N-acetylglucosamine transferase